MHKIKLIESEISSNITHAGEYFKNFISSEVWLSHAYVYTARQKNVQPLPQALAKKVYIPNLKK